VKQNRNVVLKHWWRVLAVETGGSQIENHCARG
jgi:hypothetical protein